MGDYRILFDLEGDVIIIESEIAETFMTKTLEREITRTVRQKREQLAAVREEIEDLMDYIDLLEARVKDAGKPRLSHEAVKRRYGVR